MFAPSNTFGFKLLRTLLAQDDQRERLIAPPLVFSSLALLKSAAAGTARTSLSRALGTDETLTVEQRNERVRRLRATSSLGGALTVLNQLRVQSYRPLSPSFTLLADTVFGIQAVHEEGAAALTLQSAVQARLVLPTATCTQVQRHHVVAQRFPTQNASVGIYLFQLARAPFWLGKSKLRERLLAGITENNWREWRAAFDPELTAQEAVFPQVSFSECAPLLPCLKELELGPSLTPTADFSRIMVAGNAPHLSGYRHEVQVKIERPEGSVPLPTKAPFLWMVCEETTGLIALMGGQL